MSPDYRDLNLRRMPYTGRDFRCDYQKIQIHPYCEFRYAELFCVKDIPHFFPNLFQNHPA
jgi:hypothetical protein